MKENIKMDFQMEKEKIFFQIEIFMKENIKMDFQMEKENIFFQME
jgi:hypothetical protein